METAYTYAAVPPMSPKARDMGYPDSVHFTGWGPGPPAQAGAKTYNVAPSRYTTSIAIDPIIKLLLAALRSQHEHIKLMINNDTLVIMLADK
jgi:hypothetical protein